jgi:CRISPR/Cas system CMR subunit Cmr6 (Cas7 group RAMP superfamily)
LQKIGHRCFIGELAQRAYTAHGERGVWECFVDLHPTHGFPILRASALKASLRRHLQARLSHLDEAIRPEAAAWIAALLGEDETRGTQQGVLQIHDAWWLPAGLHPGPLVADVDTTHHPAYYQGRQARAEATDAPEPQPQLAVRGRFLLALGLAPSLMTSPASPCSSEFAELPGVSESTQAGGWTWLLDRVTNWFQKALEEEGLGSAKRVGGGQFSAQFDCGGTDDPRVQPN